MTNEITFKTSEECRCELVAHTVMKDSPEWGNELRQPGANFLPVSAARASFGREDKTGDDPKADLKLMKYLADHQHLTPFEYNHATFLVECPLFIRSQIHRHRTFAFNEISRRYTSEDIAFWKPDAFRKQSKSNKQASTDETIKTVPVTYHTYRIGEGSEESTVYDEDVMRLYEEPIWEAWLAYDKLVSGGVCREQARAVLPQALITRFYMGGSLRNWVHFLKLRLDSHAQKEVQIVARKIESQLRELWPEAMGVLLPLGETS